MAVYRSAHRQTPKHAVIFCILIHPCMLRHTYVADKLVSCADFYFFCIVMEAFYIHSMH